MRLYYHKAARGNFGDDLNLWLWPQLIPELIDISQPYHAFRPYSKVQEDDSLFIGIGTLLNRYLPSPPFKVIFGAGVGYGQPPLIDERWKVYCVRGPLSAHSLGLSPKAAITDAAILLRTMNLPSRPKLYSAAFVPHYKTCRPNWKLPCKLAGIHYIDPSQSVQKTLASIQRSKLVLAEAMHAAIVADALRIPWIPVQLEGNVDEFKWHDWCQSLNLEYKPIRFRKTFSRSKSFKSNLKRKIQVPCLIAHLRWVAKNIKPTLSSEGAIENATARLQETLEQLKADSGL